MYKLFIEKIHNFYILGRYNKLYGAFLLMWPCFWGVCINSVSPLPAIKLFLLFFVGSIIMRGAGCTINDIIDKDIDKKVIRTKNRPLASSKLSIKEAYIFLFFQLIVGFIVLINFNLDSIVFSLLVVPLVILYPFLKRITFYPQFFLGIIFNWGILVASLEINGSINITSLFFYISGVFLTIGYDTIYAFQDYKDDKKINVKSFSIKIIKYPRITISVIYLISWVFLFLGIKNNNFLFEFKFLILFITFAHLFIQIKELDISNQKKLQKIFVSNVTLGLIIFLVLLANRVLFIFDQL